MTAALRLALAHARHHLGRSALLALCVCVAALLPAASNLLMNRFEAHLLDRGAATPLVIGARGNRFDLALSALYFRRIDLPTITTGDLTSIADMQLGDAIPINTRFTARTRPLVATTPDYAAFRRLVPARGEFPLMVGEVALGARVARDLQLGVGDSIFSDQRELYDLTKPAAIKLRIVGLLAPTNAPDDDAVFTDIKTAWLLEGLAHGHAPPAKLPAALILQPPGATPEAPNTVISEELVEVNEVTPDNARSFHIHADPDTLPLSAILVVPSSEKDRSILAARLNAGKSLQAIVPLDVIHELLAHVVRLRQLINAISAIVAAFTAVLLGLVGVLSLRLRARELETLQRIGVARAHIAIIVGGETALVVLAGLSAAAVALLTLSVWSVDVVKFL